MGGGGKGFRLDAAGRCAYRSNVDVRFPMRRVGVTRACPRGVGAVLALALAVACDDRSTGSGGLHREGSAGVTAPPLAPGNVIVPSTSDSAALKLASRGLARGQAGVLNPGFLRPTHLHPRVDG